MFLGIITAYIRETEVPHTKSTWKLRMAKSTESKMIANMMKAIAKKNRAQSLKITSIEVPDDSHNNSTAATVSRSLCKYFFNSVFLYPYYSIYKR